MALVEAVNANDPWNQGKALRIMGTPAPCEEVKYVMMDVAHKKDGRRHIRFVLCDGSEMSVVPYTKEVTLFKGE